MIQPPRPPPGRATCSDIGCLVVCVILIGSLVVSYSSGPAAETHVDGKFAQIGYGVTTWEVQFTPADAADEDEEEVGLRTSFSEGEEHLRVSLKDSKAFAEGQHCVAPTVMLTADAVFDATATALPPARRALRGGHGGGHGGHSAGHSIGGARVGGRPMHPYNGGVFVSRRPLVQRHLGFYVTFLMLQGHHAHDPAAYQRYRWNTTVQKYLVQLAPVCFDAPRGLLTVNVTAAGALDARDAAYLSVVAAAPVADTGAVVGADE